MRGGKVIVKYGGICLPLDSYRDYLKKKSF